jgi:hypothetical protein
MRTVKADDLTNSLLQAPCCGDLSFGGSAKFFGDLLKAFKITANKLPTT